MKSFIPILLATLVFFTGCEPEVVRVESKPTPEAKPAQPGATHRVSGPDHRITCYSCKGEQYIMIRSSGISADFRQACPICSSKGFRELVVPVGKSICPDCKGMGVLKTAGSDSATNFANKTSCQRCIGSGTVKTLPPK
jgi:hypothetical protein